MTDPAEGVYFSVPGVATVKWSQADSTVIVEWEGWANTDEFMGLLDAEIAALRENRGTKLLADCRRQRVLSPADQERADREWVPKAIAVGLKRFAVVLPASELAAVNLRDRLAKVPGTALEVGYFRSVDEARRWLTT